MNTIPLTIRAAADTSGGPEDWAHLCITAAQEAYAAALSEPPAIERSDAERMFDELATAGGAKPGPSHLSGSALSAAAHAAAAAAFRCCMPQLTNRRSVQCFVACTTTGLLRGYLDGRTSNALLYAAQAALTAHPKRASKRRK